MGIRRFNFTQSCFAVIPGWYLALMRASAGFRNVRASNCTLVTVDRERFHRSATSLTEYPSRSAFRMPRASALVTGLAIHVRIFAFVCNK